jgi:hypothetical protein
MLLLVVEARSYCEAIDVLGVPNGPPMTCLSHDQQAVGNQFLERKDSK